jgi:opine dehydrogenase
MKVGILGCGNAGLALYALMLNARNFEPFLFSAQDHMRTFNSLLSSQDPILFTRYNNESPVEMERDDFRVYHSLEALLSECRIIINTLPIDAHIDVFNDLYRIIVAKNRRIQYINLVGGFAIFDNFLRQKPKEMASIASAHTLPYASRVGKGCVNVLNRRKETLISLSDSEMTPTLKALELLMETPLTFDSNFLRCAIDRSSYVMHPLIFMLNYTIIEREEKFYFYRDGWTKSVERLLVKTGHERRQLCEKLGFFGFISPEERVRRFKEYYLEDFRNVLPPASAEHRFFREDVPYGSVFMSTLGRICGVPMPLTESIVNITSVICDKDFWASPLNLLRNEALAKTVLDYRDTAKVE